VYLSDVTAGAAVSFSVPASYSMNEPSLLYPYIFVTRFISPAEIFYALIFAIKEIVTKLQLPSSTFFQPVSLNFIALRMLFFHQCINSYAAMRF
jgi:hypothetical protein